MRSTSARPRSPAAMMLSTSPRRRRPLGFAQHPLAVAQDRAEDVVEVVRDAAGERAHRLEALRLAQPRFQPPALGPLGGLAQRALHRAHDPREAILHHVVRRADLERVDRQLLAQRAGNEDERHLGTLFQRDVQGRDAVEGRQGKVGEDRSNAGSCSAAMKSSRVSTRVTSQAMPPASSTPWTSSASLASSSRCRMRSGALISCGRFPAAAR